MNTAKYRTSLCGFRTPSPAQVRTRLTQCQQCFAGTAPAHPWTGERKNRYALFGGPPGKRQQGFTLIEMMLAFVVFAIAFGLLMEINTSALRAARRSAAYTQATLLAKTKLDQVGVGVVLEEGADHGEFEDRRYSWELDVRKTEPPAAEGGLVEVIGVDLYRVELTVRWEDGGREREAKFTTLRATQPVIGV